MKKVDSRKIGADIVTHLQAKVVEDAKPDVYHITQSFSVAIMGRIPVSVLVKYAGFVAKPDKSQTSDSKTRDATYFIIFITQAAGDDAADENIDMALSDFECYLNYPEHGAPIYGNTLIEYARVEEGAKGENAKMKGLYGWLKLVVRIMEV